MQQRKSTFSILFYIKRKKLLKNELCPVIYAHTEVNGGGVKCIELPIDTEFPTDTASLGHADHMLSELLEDIPVSVAVASGKYVAVKRILSKAR